MTTVGACTELRTSDTPISFDRSTRPAATSGVALWRSSREKKRRVDLSPFVLGARNSKTAPVPQASRVSSTIVALMLESRGFQP